MQLFCVDALLIKLFLGSNKHTCKGNVSAAFQSSAWVDVALGECKIFVWEFFCVNTVSDILVSSSWTGSVGHSTSKCGVLNASFAPK